MNKIQLATKCVHDTLEKDQTTGAIIPNICLSSTFFQEKAGIPFGIENANSYGRGFEYSRTGNPTRGKFERCVASLENCKYGVAFSSGSSAIDGVIGILDRGDKIISIDDVYGGTHRYLVEIGIKKLGLDLKFMDLNKSDLKMEKDISMIWIETPTNPLLKITDIKNIVDQVNKDCIVVVDNTFGTPCNQELIKLGVDIILHSGTKYLGGHSDLTIGVVCTNNEKYFNKLKFIQNSKGAIPGPIDCYMALRGIKTLELRMNKHNENGMKIAKFLSINNMVSKVYYPGLEDNEYFEIAKKQMSGYGGMVSFVIKKNPMRFIKNLKYFTLAESLGAVESLVEIPSLMTHAAINKEEREKLGISDNLIRLSVGIEDSQDLINDLQDAFNLIKEDT